METHGLCLLDSSPVLPGFCLYSRASESLSGSGQGFLNFIHSWPLFAWKNVKNPECTVYKIGLQSKRLLKINQLIAKPILGTSIILQIIKAYSKFASLHTNEIDLCFGFISCFVIKHPDESALSGSGPHTVQGEKTLPSQAVLWPLHAHRGTCVPTCTENNQLSVLCKHLKRERIYLAHSSMLSFIMAEQSQQKELWLACHIGAIRKAVSLSMQWARACSGLKHAVSLSMQWLQACSAMSAQLASLTLTYPWFPA